MPNIYICYPTYIPNIYTCYPTCIPNIYTCYTTYIPNRYTCRPTYMPNIYMFPNIYTHPTYIIHTCWVTRLYMLGIYVGSHDICWVTCTIYVGSHSCYPTYIILVLSNIYTQHIWYKCHQTHMCLSPNIYTHICWVTCLYMLHNIYICWAYVLGYNVYMLGLIRVTQHIYYLCCPTYIPNIYVVQHICALTYMILLSNIYIPSKSGNMGGSVG